MRLYEKEIVVPLTKENSLLKYFSEYLSNEISSSEIPIRFAVTKTDDVGYHCELGVLSEMGDFDVSSMRPIFDFRKREYENHNEFNVALVVPTGIDAKFGGHAGDASSLAILFASTCDNLITHPNVVNASDINEMTENTLYVGGNMLSRLMMGTIGLQKVRSNNLLAIFEEHEEIYFVNAAINSVSGARACMGTSCEVVRLKSKFEMKSRYSESGRPSGTIENLEEICDVISSKECDGVAISSVVKVDREKQIKYYSGGIVNPWEGCEAMLTSALSHIYNIPIAHSPMSDSKEMSEYDFGIVDPRMAAEVVSTTFLNCILKGLSKSPKIVSYENGLSVEDINCLIIPEGCIGLPTLAALEQGIPVVEVKENKNLMKNNLEDLSWKNGQLIQVDNYLEAAGVMNAIKSGLDIESVRRPLEDTKVTEYKAKR